jgi:uncharacterized surface anchored protein
MKKTVLALFIISLLTVPGLVSAQTTGTTTRTRTSTTVTNPTAASPSPTAVVTTPTVATSTVSATTKGGLPVSGNTSATLALITVGLALLSVGVYSFGRRR